MELSNLIYYAVYTLGRYRTIAAEVGTDVQPISFDFRIAEKFNDFDDCEDYCRALNIHLRGNNVNYDEEC